MRVWIDVTNSPHVALLPAAGRAARGAWARRRGHRARLRADARAARGRTGLAHAVVGPPHGGAARSARCGRWRAGCARSARSPAGGASTPRSPTRPTSSRWRRAPSGSRRRTRSTTSSRAPSTASAAAPRPGSSSPMRSRRSGSTGSAPTPRRSAATRGSRRSTTSPASRPTRPCSTPSGSTAARVLVVVRTPPEVSLYHRHGNPLFADVLERLGARPERPRGRPAAHAGAARGDRRPGASLARRAGARGRRAEPRRRCRPRRLRRRDDEPRGGRARHACLHDVLGPARRGRRIAPRRRPASCAHARDDLRLERKGETARPATRDPSLLLDRLLPSA